MLYILPRDANATWAHLLAYLDGKRSIWNSLDWRQHIKHVEINGEHLNNSRGNARMEKPAKTNLPFLESLMICNIYFFANTSSFKVFFVAVSVALTLQHRVEATAVWCGWQVCLYLEAICVKNLFFRTGMQHIQPVTIQKTHLSRSGAERCKKARWESDLKCSFLSAAPEAREAQGRHHCIDWGAFFFIHLNWWQMARSPLSDLINLPTIVHQMSLVWSSPVGWNNGNNNPTMAAGWLVVR